MYCHLVCCFFFFFKQKTAYEMRISDWSSDVCSSDLGGVAQDHHALVGAVEERLHRVTAQVRIGGDCVGAVAVEGFGRVVLGGAADVTTLGVEDHRDTGVRGVDVCDEPDKCVLGQIGRAHV